MYETAYLRTIGFIISSVTRAYATTPIKTMIALSISCQFPLDPHIFRYINTKCCLAPLQMYIKPYMRKSNSYIYPFHCTTTPEIQICLSNYKIKVND